MRKTLGYLEKIVSGEKIIESRWMKTRRAPWGKVRKGDTIYFKNTGEQVSVSAKALTVDEFEFKDPEQVKKLLLKHYKFLGLRNSQIDSFFERVKDSNYCVFISLEKVKQIKPFHINKSGHGAMSAWITSKKLREVTIYPNAKNLCDHR